MTRSDPLADAVAAVRAVPGVTDAAAAVRSVVRSGGTLTPAPVPTGRPVDGSGAGGRGADLDGGPVPVVPGAPTTLQEAVRAAARLAPDKGTTFLRHGAPDVAQTYPQLLADAQRVLAGLRRAGLRPGDPALLVFDDNQGYLTTFWACVLGGFVPTPVAVAPTYTAPHERNRTLRSVWTLLERPVLVTDAATGEVLAGVRALWAEPAVRILAVEDLLAHRAATDWFPATPDSPVLNLVTSGSTGTPKCVQHTNSGVVARTVAAVAHCGLTEHDVTLIWMPLDHVTVAFYNVRDVFLRCQHVNARTTDFLGDCLRWLDWLDRYHATNTWAPNFAYAMVNERAAEVRTRSWDLSRVREMVDGGEPVIAATSHRFLQLLAPHGLGADVLAPAWGMSETCSGVTYARQSRDDETAGTVAVDPASLGHRVHLLDPGDPGAVVLSVVGRPIPGVRVRVVDETGAPVPEGRVGELLVRGDTMMRGYHNNPQAQRDAHDGEGWFHTGDLAFAHDGEVVIAGRVKDQIIVRGHNYPAHELESVVERVDGVRVTFTAAAAVREPGSDTDQLVVFFVPDEAATLGVGTDVDAVASRIRAVLGREVGLAPDLLVPLTEAEFPKTSSGKIQRAALVERLRAGTFAGRVRDLEPANGAALPGLARRQWVELHTPPDPGPGVVLVLGEHPQVRHLDLAGDLAGDLATATVARRGTALVEELPGRFRVAADDPGQLRQLLETVAARHGRLTAVVSALPLSVPETPLAGLTTATAELAALLAAVAAAGAQVGDPAVLVLTAAAVHVRRGDRIALGTCALPGLVNTAAAESGGGPVRQLDLPADPPEWAAAVRAELADRTTTGVVAARQGRRWRPKVEPVVTHHSDGSPVAVGGLYLVTGGLGGIALELAGHLLAAYGARLLLVGRSPAEGKRAERLAELAALGAVEYRQVDVADRAALEAAVATAETRWDRPLTGVLHLAGADPTGQWSDPERHTVIAESMATFAEQYRAKVAGTLAVAEVLDRRQDAALVLFGSVNGEFGGHSFGAYAAANSFLVGFAEHWHHERRRRVQCLAWSMWAGVGMNRAQPTAAARHRGFCALEPEAGLRLFLDALATPDHYLLAGLDLTVPAMVDEVAPDQVRPVEAVVAYAVDPGSAGVAPDVLRAAVADAAARSAVPLRLAEVPTVPRTADGHLDRTRLLSVTAPGRPVRTSVPPANDLERRIAQIWSATLGRPGIGRDDSFFDLGGNSLQATRLLALLDAELAVRITTRQLYEGPTVAAMSAAVAAATPPMVAGPAGAIGPSTPSRRPDETAPT